MTSLGGAGRTTGTGWAILISGGLGTSGELDVGHLILGGSTLILGVGRERLEDDLWRERLGSTFLIGIGSVSW